MAATGGKTGKPVQLGALVIASPPHLRSRQSQATGNAAMSPMPPYLPETSWWPPPPGRSWPVLSIGLPLPASEVAAVVVAAAVAAAAAVAVAEIAAAHTGVEGSAGRTFLDRGTGNKNQATSWACKQHCHSRLSWLTQDGPVGASSWAGNFAFQPPSVVAAAVVAGRRRVSWRHWGLS